MTEDSQPQNPATPDDERPACDIDSRHSCQMTAGESRYVRWQGRLLAQLGFVNNTVLALTTAGLGFAVSREPAGWAQCALWAGIMSLGASVALALWCAINRLHDFRETAQLARGKMGETERCVRRRENRRRGERTWVLLYFQLATFALGTVLVVVSVGLGPNQEPTP